jgi:hypothetical protein
MRTILIALTMVGVLVGPGCTSTVTEHKQYGPGGTLVESSRAVNDQTVSELHRILGNETIRGTGKFRDESEHLAKRGALLIAEADLASRAGEVIQSRDETLYNDKVYSVLRTQSRNVIKGYDITFENWDPVTREYTINIEARGYSVADEIAKYIK